MLSSTALKQRWWLHRDQKLAYDNARDICHIKMHPNAFSVEKCYQSSLYMMDSIEEEHDGFICCPGSHLWDDTEGWESSGDRHHVSVPYTDQRVVENISKLVVYAGEMILWDSRLAHMGGYVGQARKKATGLLVKMLRLDPIEPDDFHGIRRSLNRDGVCLVKSVADADDMHHTKEQLRRDISDIYNLPIASEWNAYPQECYGRPNKGGGAWGPIACGKAAWDARLLPKRVKIFQELLDLPNIEDMVVSIDSVHWSVEHPRLSFMASFSPKSTRTDEAYKRKCIAHAYGLARTTHWANIGDISTFNYGSERNSIPQKRYESISKSWKGYGSMVVAPDDVRHTYVKQLAKKLNTVAVGMTTDEATALLDPSVSAWL
jgi:hypothetical protein